MKRDDVKFLTALVLTVVLAGGVIYAGWRRDLRLAQGPVVDVGRIQELVQQGRLSLQEAEFYERMEQTDRGTTGVKP